jgi:uncharacterized protein involved in exopolysaccharide biosynthesis
MILRLFEAFFRRWVLYLLPMALLIYVGVWMAARTPSTYQSTGTIYVEGETLLSSLSDVPGESFGYDTPASATSNKINSLLQTDSFIGDIAADAGLEEELAEDPALEDELRKAVYTSPVGPNLLNVGVTHKDPVVAQRVAQSAIDVYVKWVIDADVLQSNAAESFFTDLLPVYQAQIDSARNSLAVYLQEHPAPPPGGVRADEEVAEIARLNTQIDDARERYANALTKSEEARLSTEQTMSDIGQRLRVVDAPQVPENSLPKIKTAAITFAIFVLLGLAMSLGAVVIGALLDHTVRFPFEVKDRLGARLLTVVPDGGPERLVHPGKRRRGTPGNVHRNGVPTNGVPTNGVPTNGAPANGSHRKPAGATPGLSVS